MAKNHVCSCVHIEHSNNDITRNDYHHQHRSRIVPVSYFALSLSTELNIKIYMLHCDRLICCHLQSASNNRLHIVRFAFANVCEALCAHTKPPSPLNLPHKRGEKMCSMSSPETQARARIATRQCCGQRSAARQSVVVFIGTAASRNTRASPTH